MKTNNILRFKYFICFSILVEIMIFNELVAGKQISFDDLILVRAKVAEFDEKKDYYNVSLWIEHVYCGSQDLINTSFDFKSIKIKAGSYSPDRGIELNPPILEKGEKIICQLYMKDGKLDPRLPDELWELMPPGDWPTREKTFSKFNRFSECIKFANAVEEYCNSAYDDKLNILKKHSLNKSPETSYWAIKMIAKVYKDISISIFDEVITNNRLNNLARVAIDYELTDLRGDEWNKSLERANFFEKIVNSKMDKYIAEAVRTRLNRSKFDPMFLLELTEKFIWNQDIDIDSRYLLTLNSSGYLKQSDQISDKAFSILIEIIDRSNEQKLQIGASYGIYNASPLKSNYIEVLKKRVEILKDDNLKKTLNLALEKSLQHTEGKN